MNLQDLIRRFRVLAKDQHEPLLFATEDVTDWLNDAQAQACVRARLLLDDATQQVCEVEIVSGQHTYPLHPSLYELVIVRFKPIGGTSATPLKLVSREWLDANVRDWRDLGGWHSMDSCVRYAVQGDTSIRIVPAPAEGGTLFIEGYRLPLQSMVLADDAAAPPVAAVGPEIHMAHHEKLIQWALHRAFSVPDSETFDPDRSVLSEREFTAYFGLMPDADMRRITREDVEHHNEGYLS